MDEFLQSACERWCEAGFKFYEGKPAATNADHLLQKRIREGHDTLFFINVFIYDSRKYGEDRVGFLPEVQFNIDDDNDHKSFNVNLVNGNDGAEFAEEFFMNVYRLLQCKPYEKGGT